MERTDALQLLNTTLVRLLEEPESTAPFTELLGELERIFGASSSAILTCTRDNGPQELLCCTVADDADVHRRHARTFAREVSDAGDGARWMRELSGDGWFAGLALGNRQLPYGFLLMKGTAHNGPDALDGDFVESLATGLPAIMGSARRARDNLRKGLHDERAAIARELHDSLAQSLSYLKIQASRLQHLIDHGDSKQHTRGDDLEGVCQEIRSSLNLAYRQLRELMTTFRLTMNGRNLGQALEEAVEELEKRSGIVFVLDNRLDADLLSVDEEMQVLQVIREALSNVVRHAHARRANIALSREGERTVVLTVDDDGVGIDGATNRDQHHGLIIMQERAHSLGGEMKIRTLVGGGTRVEVSFAARTAAPSSRPGARPE